MHEIDLMRLDLNLLVTLEVLLEERHVTRAARRLGRSQSATSHALGRLRDMFDDPLLVPARGGMVPTPLAEALRVPLGQALAQVRGLFRVEDAFIPETSARLFRIGCPDLLGVLLPELIARLNAEAPHVRVELGPAPPDPEGALARGALDVVLGPAAHGEADGAALRGRSVGTLRWLSLVRSGHPLCDGEVDVARWCAWPHVQVRTGSRSPSLVGSALEAQGVTRTIGSTVPGFLIAAQVVARTDSVFTTPHLLCAWAAEVLGLVTIAPPVPLPDVAVRMSWHARWQEDAGHRWFRRALASALAACWASPSTS